MLLLQDLLDFVVLQSVCFLLADFFLNSVCFILFVFCIAMAIYHKCKDKLERSWLFNVQLEIFQ